MLAQSAMNAGATGIAAMGRAGAAGVHPGNTHRDLMRQYLKDTTVPEPYFADIPIHDVKSDQDHVTIALPFLLVHEMIASMVKKCPSITNELSVLPPNTRLDNLAMKFARDNGVDRSRILPLGIHGDGVPYKKNRSCQVISWNFLATPHAERFMFVNIGKEFCCQCGCGGRHTLDPIIEIFVWSMKCTARGQWPMTRHDGSAWQRTDKSRCNKVGPLLFFALLFQSRGDWSWYKELFGFPSWISKSICWRCQATQDTFKNHTRNSPWRTARLTGIEFAHLQTQAGITRSPLFLCPYFCLWMVIVDVLHCLDLGVAQDVLGNLFWEVQKYLMPGRTIKQRIKVLWHRLQEYYAIAQPTSQTQALTHSMIKCPNKSPKLRLKGGETRGIVAFGLELAKALHHKMQTTHTETIQHLFISLLDMYMLMACEEFDADAADASCRRFCNLYGALYDEAIRIYGPENKLWVQKPKLHMLEELMEYQGRDLSISPNQFWCYKDEDFVGFVATFAGSRGGRSSCGNSSLRCLQRYRAWIHDL